MGSSGCSVFLEPGVGERRLRDALRKDAKCIVVHFELHVVRLNV